MANEPWNEVLYKAALQALADSPQLVQSIGDVSDVPWTGTGDGTVIAILKGIYLNTDVA